MVSLHMLRCIHISKCQPLLATMPISNGKYVMRKQAALTCWMYCGMNRRQNRYSRARIQMNRHLWTLLTWLVWTWGRMEHSMYECSMQRIWLSFFFAFIDVARCDLESLSFLFLLRNMETANGIGIYSTWNDATKKKLTNGVSIWFLCGLDECERSKWKPKCSLKVKNIYFLMISVITGNVRFFVDENCGHERWALIIYYLTSRKRNYSCEAVENI